MQKNNHEKCFKKNKVTVYGEFAVHVLWYQGKLKCTLCKKKISYWVMGYTYLKRDEKRGTVICDKCKYARPKGKP